MVLWKVQNRKINTSVNYLKTVGNSYEIENINFLNNGDWLCLINKNNEAEVIYVNSAENGFVYPNVLKEIKDGTFIYKNNDAAFIKIVEKEDSAIRKISTNLLLFENEDGFKLTATDEDGGKSVVKLIHTKEVTKNNESIAENIKIQLAKTDFTPFTADEIDIVFSQNWFVPISKINEMRRLVFDKLASIQIENYKRKKHKIEKTSHGYPETKLDYMYDVANKTARKFYENSA